jgi:hypothetical protein
MKYNCPRLNDTNDSFRMKVSIEFTELEWKLGFLKRYRSLYLLVKYIKIKPIGANNAIIGCRGIKNAVMKAVLMI